ncbi:hypothetical protein TWF225_000162 [Orbilia oligospora]|uniref:Uncharacterized protein n=1 Tax=Orbilia oligospora TaxID=2813651 RepID=A0A7C8TYZ2_ORBOL|nr:hypothetical protein TWF751_004193 [Orbilia oligospora]KAF3195782.1 hypothetical protein TWF225_000162 [Orbilia oligospora]KAF3235124.1 hypothetical protein TWF128_002119 [Orbilia oligospora]KAF3259937.1 hypothetical protein TWF217_004968 [Orbilia oligospora]KAF3297529.1 hypothetical protein TWF132_005953 [Orbilia oligospora]
MQASSCLENLVPEDPGVPPTGWTCLFRCGPEFDRSKPRRALQPDLISLGNFVPELQEFFSCRIGGMTKVGFEVREKTNKLAAAVFGSFSRYSLDGILRIVNQTIDTSFNSS